MKLRFALIAAAAALYAGSPMAQTYSPNPNKAQNSDMRTQSGGALLMPSDTYYVTPSTTTEVYVTPSVAPAEVYVYPSEPVAGRRSIYVPANPNGDIGQNYTPNPNKFQNNGVPTQGGDMTIWYSTPLIIGY